ncbi:TPM domain-containing protein [Ileibacterium valens]|uniref:TPM domain-containing protein n=1 Tax=Ileibacterium valens TaxID=1862668 RepID=UPI0024BB96EC|nr:TPM domain-containing protein [Ileibacterium valens]
MKRINIVSMLVFTFLSIWIMPIFTDIRVYAAEIVVMDDAGLFTESEIDKIEDKAAEISQKYDMNILIATTYEPGFSDNEARDFIESFGSSRYPEGYLAYAINMSDRSYWVEAYGDTYRSLITQDVADTLADKASDELYEGEFYGSAMAFLDRADRELAVSTDPMGWLKKPFIFWETSLIALFISLVGAAVVTVIMTLFKAKGHQDKQLAYDAAGYGDSLNLMINENRFISHYQTRIRKPKQSSSGHSGGTGSSGHTGSGGHF